MTSYLAIVHKEKNSQYGVCFPDFPGCITAGENVEEAYALAQEVLEMHIAGMKEDGDNIPPPMSFEKARKHGFAKDCLMTFMVDAHVPTRMRRINITMDEILLHEIDTLTSNRSAFLADAARAQLHLQQE